MSRWGVQTLSSPRFPRKVKRESLRKVHDGKLDDAEKNFVADRAVDSKDLSAKDDVLLNGEGKPSELLSRKKLKSIKKFWVPTKSDMNERSSDETSLHSTSCYVGGRACWCALGYYTRCLVLRSRVIYSSYSQYGYYSCYGDVYKTYNRICIRPKCCARVYYVRA